MWQSLPRSHRFVQETLHKLTQDNYPANGSGDDFTSWFWVHHLPKVMKKTLVYAILMFFLWRNQCETLIQCTDTLCNYHPMIDSAGAGKPSPSGLLINPNSLNEFLVGGFIFFEFSSPTWGNDPNWQTYFSNGFGNCCVFFMILSFRWSIYILTSNLLTTSTRKSCQDSIRAGAQSVAATVAWGWNCDGGGNIATLESQRWKKNCALTCQDQDTSNQTKRKLNNHLWKDAIQCRTIPPNGYLQLHGL